MRSKLFIVFTMVVLFISGCQSSEKKEEVVQDANNYTEEAVQDANNYSECSELETTSSNTVLSDNLLYREYSLGEKFNAGEILISKETLLDITKNPDSVIVFFNDEMLETISYSDDDIHIDLVNDGVYCFVIIDKDGETIDITPQIQGTSYLEDGKHY